MRRGVAGLLLLFLVGTAAPALAEGSGSAPTESRGLLTQVFLSATSIELGDRLKIWAHNCKSGDEWEARIQVTFKDDNGDRVLRRTVEADDDGKTRIKFRIGSRNFAPGGYKVIVKCIHIFNGGDKQNYYVEKFDLEVLPPSS